MTPKQDEVFKEICMGKSNKQIARELGMAEATVKLHATNVFKELGVRNRGQAIIQAKNPAQRTLTALEILEEFATVALTTPNDTWPTKVVKFGQAIQKRSFG